MTVQVISLLSN